MNDITVAINVTNHDWGITVLKDGKLEDIILEDRTSGIKYKWDFPLTSLHYLKKQYSKINTVILLIGDKDNVEDNTISELKALQIEYDELIVADKTLHHLYHAFAGFCSSKFNEATILSIDGWGGTQIIKDEESERIQEGVTTTSIWKMSYNKGFEKKYSRIWYTPLAGALKLPDWEIKHLQDKNDDWLPTIDIGAMYFTVARHLGFQWMHDAGKVMGLSAYGKKNDLPSFLWEDTIHCNPSIFLNNLSIDTNYHHKLHLDSFENFKNIAYNIQRSFEKVILTRVKQALNLSKSNNLIFTGGCALNVLVNYLIKKHFPNINLYIDPIAHDANQGLGAAKYYFRKKYNFLPKDPLNNLYLGPRYTKEEILNSIKKYA